MRQRCRDLRVGYFLEAPVNIHGEWNYLSHRNFVSIILHHVNIWHVILICTWIIRCIFMLFLLQRRVILKACKVRQHYIRKVDLISPYIWCLTRETVWEEFT